MDRRCRLLVTLGLAIFAQPTLAQEQGAKPAVHAKSAMAYLDAELDHAKDAQVGGGWAQYTGVADPRRAGLAAGY